SCRVRSRACRVRRPSCVGPGAHSVPTPRKCWAHSTTADAAEAARPDRCARPTLRPPPPAPVVPGNPCRRIFGRIFDTDLGIVALVDARFVVAARLRHAAAHPTSDLLPPAGLVPSGAYTHARHSLSNALPASA